jgi:diaminohydroxyphosphoribosylaminopyrimidine deaminase / 5-amino-6-(5-phosphoribosylamino)uracil reductase
MSLHTSHGNDDLFLHRALDLARAGIALASPNPHVGCVITTENGAVVGEGFHTYEGKKHAEILALEHAGARSRGAALYVNLEPCSHQGRTGPCADAVIAAGIRRVVCSLQDPNPAVAGQGFDKLRAAGIEVEVGGLEAEARQLNEAFAKYIRHKIPLVTLKCAMTLDGKIAGPASSANSPRGEKRTNWITGEGARAHVQQLRHQSDAILTGIGTVLSDDPLLTDRTGLPRRRPLLRVVLDSRLRLPVDSRLAQSALDDVLVFTETADASRKAELERLGVRVELAPRSGENTLDLSAILKRLGELEITNLLVEGGSHMNASLLDSGLVDKVFLYLAPKIFGDAGTPFAAGLNRSFAFKNPQFHQFAEDCAIEAYLKDPYSD